MRKKESFAQSLEFLVIFHRRGIFHWVQRLLMVSKQQISKIN